MDFYSQTVTLASPLTRTPITNLTPITILDILVVVHIWDGVVIRGIALIATSIGVTIDQITITKAITKTVTEATSVTATIITMEAINAKAIRDVISEGKLNAMTNG